MFLNDSISDGQAKPRASSELFRRKKWIVNLLQVLLGDANTSINHFDSEGRIRAGSPDQELSAVRHGVFGINEEIEKDLLKFALDSRKPGERWN